MAAKSKAELIAVAEKEFGKLEKLIRPISAETALAKDSDGTSIKDVIGHRAHWIKLYLGWYADGMAGKEVFFPAEGYKWNDLKRFNTALREEQKELSWEDAQSLLDERHAELMHFITDLEDDALYGQPMKGANNDWTPGRWAEAAGPSHYRSAAKYIRARLRELGR